MTNVAVGASCSAGTWQNAPTTGGSPQGAAGGSICLSRAGDLAPLSTVPLGPPAWELQTLTATALKPFCRLALCQNPVGGCALAAGPQHQAHFPQPHILKPGQDLIRRPQAGGGSCWGGKAFAGLLLNHSTVGARIRLSGNKCTGATYLGSARQPGAVERWVFEQSSLPVAGLNPCPAQPLLLSDS